MVCRCHITAHENGGGSHLWERETQTTVWGYSPVIHPSVNCEIFLSLHAAVGHRPPVPDSLPSFDTHSDGAFVPGVTSPLYKMFYERRRAPHNSLFAEKNLLISVKKPFNGLSHLFVKGIKNVQMSFLFGYSC